MKRVFIKDFIIPLNCGVCKLSLQITPVTCMCLLTHKVVNTYNPGTKNGKNKRHPRCPLQEEKDENNSRKINRRRITTKSTRI